MSVSKRETVLTLAHSRPDRPHVIEAAAGGTSERPPDGEARAVAIGGEVIPTRAYSVPADNSLREYTGWCAKFDDLTMT